MNPKHPPGPPMTLGNKSFPAHPLRAVITYFNWRAISAIAFQGDTFGIR